MDRTNNIASGQNRFTTTRWSIILSSGDGASKGEEGHAAISQLCRIYWRPVFAFIQRRGNSISDAQDLTQDFFMSVLEGNLLQSADPSRGRFRSLLLAALQRFLLDAHDRRSARKRGGDLKFVVWDDWMSEAPSHLSFPAHALDSWSAERLFDVRWAATVVEQSLRRLREDCEVRGRRRVFDALNGSLSADRADVSYRDLAALLGVTEAAVKKLVHGLRQRYRALLRQEVARTVETKTEVESEIRYLCAVLAAGSQ